VNPRAGSLTARARSTSRSIGRRSSAAAARWAARMRSRYVAMEPASLRTHPRSVGANGRIATTYTDTSHHLVVDVVDRGGLFVVDVVVLRGGSRPVVLVVLGRNVVDVVVVVGGGST